jgi:hypothetical protein
VICRYMKNQTENSAPKIHTKWNVSEGHAFLSIVSIVASTMEKANRSPVMIMIMMLSSFRQRLGMVNVTFPLLALLLFALPSLAQNVRWDDTATTTTGVGQLVPVLAIPGASISFYTGCTALPCTTPAVTFNASTGSTACPSNAQVVWQLPIAAGCKSTADSQGNFGGYFTSGTYQFTETISGHVAGPYQFNVGAGGSGSIGGNTTANEGVGAANANNTLAPVAETGYETVGGVTTYTCNEDHAKGIWDVRCHGWSSNPSTALTNTIQLAKCYQFAPPAGAVAGIVPVVNIPAGSYSLGGNISIPPGIDIEGVGGTEFGSLTSLTTTDTSQPMMTQVPSETFTCSGTPFTASGNGGTIGNLELVGGNAAANTDIGLVNQAASDYIHNITFTHFGGPGRTLSTSSNGINSRGSHVLATSNLSWYFQSGAYNPTSFADTAIHGSLELTDVDSSWDHVEETGFLQDSGYFNRYNLVGILFAGYRLTDSYPQINPHDIWVPLIGYSPIISHNRFDDGWWDGVHMVSSNSSIEVSDNLFLGYCTSPTLNPANFSTNPGGVTTDAGCSAIESFNLGSKIALNSFEQLGAVWPFWSIGDVLTGGNAINGAPSLIDQPGSIIVGAIGASAPANLGADASRSLFNITATVGPGGIPGGGGNIPLSATSGVPGNSFVHYFLNDGTAANYTGFTGGIPDTYLTIMLGVNDTITPSSAITTCTGAPIKGTTSTAALAHPIWFWNNNGKVLQEVCTSGLAASAQVPVSCSGGGTAIFAQPFSGPNYKAISIQSIACSGTASYTYPNSFTYTPSAGGAKSAFATTISTTAVTVTGDGTSGFLKLEALQ